MGLSRNGRRLVMLLVCLVILGAAARLTRGLWHRGPRIPAVEVEKTQRRDITVTIEATGVVEPVDLVEVKSKASGQILKMPVEVGSVVHTGDLVAQIDTVDVENQYEQAQAAARAAQAKVDVSAAQLKRADDLYKQGIITIDEHESASLDYANSQSALVKARTDFDSARQRRDDATVRAPISGTVLEQLVSAGQVITSATSSVSGGSPLIRMADLSRIRIRALVAETDIGSVQKGQVATVSVEAFPQRSFSGAVEKVEPEAVVQQSVTMFPVLISIPNEDQLLLPGMNGEVSMTVDRRTNVLAVPLDAVRTVRELPAVAASLGLDADSIRAQIARQVSARMGGHALRPGGGADSSQTAASAGGGGANRWGGRRNRTGAGGNVAMGSARNGAAAGPGGNPSPGGDPGAGGATAGNGPGGFSPGMSGNGGLARAQAVLVKTARGIEPRLVRIGLSDFDYSEVLRGLDEGDEVILLSVLEQQAKRTETQSQIRQRMGGSMPGTPAGGGRGGR